MGVAECIKCCELHLSLSVPPPFCPSSFRAAVVAMKTLTLCDSFCCNCFKLLHNRTSTLMLSHSPTGRSIWAWWAGIHTGFRNFSNCLNRLEMLVNSGCSFYSSHSVRLPSLSGSDVLFPLLNQNSYLSTLKWPLCCLESTMQDVFHDLPPMVTLNSLNCLLNGIPHYWHFNICF